jgi:hypothetical protein
MPANRDAIFIRYASSNDFVHRRFRPGDQLLHVRIVWFGIVVVTLGDDGKCWTVQDCISSR